jgi:hypothetical protein
MPGKTELCSFGLVWTGGTAAPFASLAARKNGNEKDQRENI